VQRFYVLRFWLPFSSLPERFTCGPVWDRLSGPEIPSRGSERSELFRRFQKHRLWKLRGVSIELSGIPASLLNDVLNEVRVLGPCNIWLALFDATGTLIADPFLSYQGKMDQPSISDDGKTITCAIAIENVLVDLNRPCYRRYTPDDQQIDLAATLTRLGLSPSTVDTGFRFVPGMQEQIIFWGTSPSSSNNV